MPVRIWVMHGHRSRPRFSFRDGLIILVIVSEQRWLFPRRPVSLEPGHSVQKAIGSSPVQRYRPDALNPEFIDPRIADVEALARWFDYAFVLPGGFRFGLAGIIGIVPVLGDVFDALVSVYIVARSIELGINRVTIARMLGNVAIEAIAGAIPFIGDLFDVAFKANRRNYLLLKSHIAEPKRKQKYDWLFLIATLLIAAAGVALPIWLTISLWKRF